MATESHETVGDATRSMMTWRLLTQAAVVVGLVGCNGPAVPPPPPGPSAELRVAVVGASGMSCVDRRTTIRGLAGQTDLVSAQREHELEFIRFSARVDHGVIHQGAVCESVMQPRQATAHCYARREPPRADLPVGIRIETARTFHAYTAAPSDLTDAMNGCVEGRGRWERVE